MKNLAEYGQAAQEYIQRHHLVGDTDGENSYPHYELGYREAAAANLPPFERGMTTQPFESIQTSPITNPWLLSKSEYVSAAVKLLAADPRNIGFRIGYIDGLEVLLAQRAIALTAEDPNLSVGV